MHTKPIVQAKLAHTGPDMLSRCPVGACPPLDKEPRHARARVSCPPPAGAARLSSSSIIAAAALSLPLGNARAASAGERSNSLSHACAARTHVVSAESGAAGGDVDCATGAWPVVGRGMCSS